MVDVSKLKAGQFLTSHEAAALLQVNPSSVNKWVNTGQIQAFKTPGGHRRITVEKLANFILDFNLPMPPALQELVLHRVLWVDPDTRARRSLERANDKNAQIELTTVTSFRHALVKLGFVRPHALVLDARLSDRSAFVRQLRSWDETQALKIYFAGEEAGYSPEPDVLGVVKRGSLKGLFAPD